MDFVSLIACKGTTPMNEVLGPWATLPLEIGGTCHMVLLIGSWATLRMGYKWDVLHSTGVWAMGHLSLKESVHHDTLTEHRNQTPQVNSCESDVLDSYC